MNMCSRMWKVEKPETSYLQQVEEKGTANKSNNYHYLEQEEGSHKSFNFFNLIFVLLLLSIILYYGYSKQWFKNYSPKWVLFKTLVFRNKINQRVYMRMTVVNNTNVSKTFLAPNVSFRKFNKTREFQIKTDVFP